MNTQTSQNSTISMPKFFAHCGEFISHSLIEEQQSEHSTPAHHVHYLYSNGEAMCKSVGGQGSTRYIWQFTLYS